MIFNEIIDLNPICSFFENNMFERDERFYDGGARWAISARRSSCRLTVRKMVLILLRRVFKVKKQKQRNAR